VGAWHGAVAQVEVACDSSIVAAMEANRPSTVDPLRTSSTARMPPLQQRASTAMPRQRRYGGGPNPPLDFNTPHRWYKQRNLHVQLRPVTSGDPPRVFFSDRVDLGLENGVGVRASSSSSVSRIQRTEQHLLKQQHVARHTGDLELNLHRHRGKEMDSIVLRTTFKAAKRELADNLRQSHRFQARLRRTHRPPGAQVRSKNGRILGIEPRPAGFEPIEERWRTSINGVDTEVVPYAGAPRWGKVRKSDADAAEASLLMREYGKAGKPKRVKDIYAKAVVTMHSAKSKSKNCVPAPSNADIKAITREPQQFDKNAKYFFFINGKSVFDDDTCLDLERAYSSG